MLLGFKKQFVPKIQNLSKGFTLRDKPKRKPREGEILHMYTGLRTKNCALITREFRLLKPQRVTLRISEASKNPLTYIVKINIGGNVVPDNKLYDFVVMDGFDGVSSFVQYWTDDFKYSNVKRILYMFPWQPINHLLK
jgi:hypothetical protein